MLGVDSKEYKYKIGDWVIFKHTASLQYDNNGERIVCIDDASGIGQVCGAVRRYLGPLVSLSKINENINLRSSPFMLAREGRVELYLIRQGMLNRPREVLEEHIKKVARPQIGLPWFFALNNEHSLTLIRRARIKDTI